MKTGSIKSENYKTTFYFSSLQLTNSDHLIVENLTIGYDYPLLFSWQLNIKGEKSSYYWI